MKELLEPNHFWENLLSFIEDGKVIPVVGPRLVIVETDQGKISLYRHLAQQLAKDMGARIDDLPPDYYLNDVVYRLLDNGKRTEDIYPRIRILLQGTSFPLSGPLLDLAAISQFRLFVSLTFDNLLAKAINEKRFGGEARTREIAYSLRAPHADLSQDWKKSTNPIVYQFFGKVSTSRDYVICDDDLMEFFHTMQIHDRKPDVLLDELRTSHLLLLGCHLSDWPARFFLRIAKNQQLSQQRSEIEVLADKEMAQDADLARFLKQFSYKTIIWPDRTDEFVAELAKRWQERHPVPPLLPPEPDETDPAMEPGAIFLSYASEDLEIAQRVKSMLEDVRCDVWFDKRQLEPGDEWDRKIRTNIDNCSLFVPIVSAATAARPHGYFRKEWALASRRADEFFEGSPFIFPVTIDGTTVPDAFRRFQSTPLSNGLVAPEFSRKLSQLQRDYRRPRQAA
jgi:hypothetical protein